MNTLPPLFNITSNLKSNNSKMLLFKVIALISLILYIFTYIFPSSYGYVIILVVFSLIIANYYIIYSENSISNDNNTIMNHLMTLQEITNKYIDKKLENVKNKLSKKVMYQIYTNNNLNSLYIDSDLIEFLYSVKELSKWNDSEFYLLLKGTNNILQLRKEIEEFYDKNNSYPDNINQMMENALILRTNTINNMHNFIYTVPKTSKMYNYIDKIIERYMILISRNTDKIYYYTKDNIKQKGINTESNLALIYNTVKPNDNLESSYYI